MSDAPDDRAGDADGAAADDGGGARIAVIGMAGRFPGSPSIDAYWKNLRAGVESVKFFTDEELLAAGESPETLRDPAYVKAWPVLEDMDLFDAGFFGMSPRDAAVMDPQHRFFLEVAWGALEHAGYAPDPDLSIGVFAANGMNTYMMYHLVTNPEIMSTVGEWLVRHTGNDMNFLATRVSYQMNLKGPSLNVQTACSSALVALHLASQSLLNGECDLALAGASTFSLPQDKGYLFKEGEILSRDGHCRPFDAGSRGTLFGSGTGCVVLKRLADARADGDNVLAVLLGSAINNDGSQKVGYLAPSVDGQARAIAEALAISGVDPASVSYVETHGTGTAVGDPIEVAALNQAYGAQGDGDARPGTCAIGSVKGNIGHIGEAAGMAGLIKTILALQHRELPPSINYERPNPEIDFARGPFFVNDKLRPWSAARGARRRAGVTALGAGGTNVHVIVEEAPPASPAATAPRAQQLLVLSAKSAGAVERAAGELATHLEANPGLALADVAHTLQVGRKAFAHRRIATGHDVASAVASLREPASKSKSNTHQLAGQGTPTVVFMFPGGGAQYAGMGRDLAASEPVYARAIDECLATLEPAAARELRALMVPGAGEAAQAAASTTLERPSLALPALFATEYAMAKLLESWGVEPAAFIGHSMGEYVAACLAGVFSVKDGMALVRLRGRLFERLPPGGMLSVELGEAELTTLLGPELSIAAVNAPALCVASGPVAALDRLERELASREIETTRIHISVAAHSKMLEPILAELEAFCRTIRFSAPTVPFVSNVTGTWITPELAVDPAYWVRHLRSTVRFSDGLATIARGGQHVLLEVGPGRTLASLARQHEGAGAAMPSMRHPREEANDVSFLLQSVGRAWLAGAPVDFARLGGEGRRRVPLPTYSFERNRYWIEAGSPTAGANSKKSGPLRKLSDPASWFYAPTWKPAPAPPPGEPTGAPWLVFDGATGLGDALAARLPDQPLVRVLAGPAYAKVSDDHYVIRPDAREDYEALVAELQQQDRLPEQIVHLWGVTVAKPEWPRALLARLGRAPEASAELDYDETERLCFTSLLYVAQTFGPLDKPLSLSIVSTGLHGFKAAGPVEPAKALLLGPARVIPREFPQVRARSIDLPSTFEGVEATVERLVLELAAPPRETVVALRGRERWSQGFEPVALAASEGVPGLVRRGGVYLVTGGLGGIGLELAAHLAATARAKLVLVGRTPLPPRSRWAALAAAGGALGRRVAKVLEIEATGGEVLVAAADVTSRADMERVRARARARFGEVNGVIHSAGTLDDGLISLKTREAAHRVIDVKARGALVLDEVFGKDELDLFVVFSSVSSVLGLEGQIDYTAANAFLDAFAERKTAEGRTHAVSIAWNAWQEIGMAAGLGKSPTAASRGTEPPVAGPWLERKERDTTDETLYVTTFARGKQWVLSEHVVRQGEALIPGTGYLELARAAFSGGAAFAPVEIRDLTFLAPFVVVAGHPRDLHVRLAGAGDERELTIYSGSAEEPHVTGRVARAVTPPPARADIAALLRRCALRELVAGGFLPQPFMDFGPRWANVDRVHFGAGEAVVALALPDALAADLADFPLHPALLDMATGGAQALIEGFDPDKDFYVPFAYGRFTAHRPLTTRLWSHVRARGGAARDLALFDVTIYDAEGEVVADVAGFTMKRVARGFSTAAAPAASRDGFGEGKLGSAVKLGILPAEGRDAFDRVLAARLPGHVVASSVDLRDWMAEVEEQARPGGAGGDAEEAGFARPALGAAFVSPRNEVERSLATMWREILGLKEVGVHDDFFELGGQSLVAVRLFNKIRKRYGVDLPLSTLFAAPTIESCARVVAHEAGLPLVDDEPGDAAAPAADGAPATIEGDPSRWFHRLAWRQRARERATGRERRVWLAFLDATGAVASLAERLRADGDTVVTVREGDTFHKLGDDEYQLFPEQGRQGYEALLRDLDDNGRAPDGILHAWLLTDRETFRPGSSFLHRNVEVGFFSLLALGQTLATREDPRPVHLVALTTGMQRVAQEPLRYPEKAAALGPLLALAREVPGLTASAVDVELPTRQGGLLGRVAPSPKSMLQAFATRGARPAGDEDPMAPLVEALRAEVLSASRDEIVALRGASRYVLGVERATLDAAPTRVGLKDRGVVLLTGGLDGPGAALARELATRHQARLVLLEPTPLPEAADRVAWLAAHAENHADDQPAAALVRRVLELEALGAEVMTAAAELTDVERLREVVSAVEARWGRLDGVIHAGAAPSATPVVETRLADVTNVFAPRVYGTLALAEALRERSLDFFVTWSLTSPATAEAGQAVDVAAAAFLDAFAETARDRRMLALDGGADLDAAQALDVLERAIRGCPHAKVLVSRVDPTAVRAPAPRLAPGGAAPPSASRRAGGGELGIADIGPDARLMHLVKMHPGPALSKPPFFLVAGLFGNVLNLRSLAHILGSDRAVYGLQARGLFGGLEPHETFEEMASDYLVELRALQPHGPYFLGGFSGGGITAYEMARQLMDAGETVRLVVLLDTPVPRRETLSATDRASIQVQNLQREGVQYFSRWMQSKIEYRLKLQRREEQLRKQQGGESRDFHSQVIEAAFYRALDRYTVRPLAVPVALFRPKIEPTYRLSGGRMLDKGRSPLYPDNGWTPYVTHQLDIVEVPGNHDSMVLEPNVRVLAARIDEAMARASQPAESEPFARVSGEGA